MSNETTTTVVPAGSELLQKLLNISAAMGTLPKNGRNDFHEYNYVTESDAMNRFRELCVAEGVFVFPNVTSSVCEDTLTEVMVDFTVTDVTTGQTIVMSMPGQGSDKGDKGVYKAITGAYKYFIMKTFMVPAGDDPEADTATDKRVSPGKGKAPTTNAQTKGGSFGASKTPTLKTPAAPKTLFGAKPVSTTKTPEKTTEEAPVAPVAAKTSRFGAKKVTEDTPSKSPGVTTSRFGAGETSQKPQEATEPAPPAATTPKAGFKRAGFKGFGSKAAS